MIIKGLPVSIIESHNSTKLVDRARTACGAVLGSGRLRLGAIVEGEKVSVDRSATETVAASAELLEKAISSELAPYADRSPLKRLLSSTALPESGLPISFVAGHNAVLALNSQGDAVVLDAEICQSLRPANETGVRGILALCLSYSLEQLTGGSERDGLHAVFALFDQFPEDLRSDVLSALSKPVIDAGNTLGIALRTLVNALEAKKLEEIDITPLAGIDSLALLAIGKLLGSARPDTGDGMPTAEKRRQLISDLESHLSSTAGHVSWRSRLQSLDVDRKEKFSEAVNSLLFEVDRTFKWRDKWATWIIGQARIDIPYNQRAVIDVLETPMEDVDEKRAIINDIITRSYDREIEGTNIRRLSEWTLENDVNLVAGRLSRAFGNQAHLLSASSYVHDRSAMKPAVSRLREAAGGVRAIETQVTRISGLVEQARPVPNALIVGAIDRCEEALIAFQTKEQERLLERKSSSSEIAVVTWESSTTGKALSTLARRMESLFVALDDVRQSHAEATTRDAAYVLFLQRLHPAETIMLANANSNREVHPGKEEDLRDLTRLGGHNMYSSQGAGIDTSGDGVPVSVNWVSKVGDWIEAIPLFIKERVVSRKTRIGGEEIDVESVETEVDQAAMEIFFRLHAEYWAKNIAEVADSEHVALAREVLAGVDTAIQAEVEQNLIDNPEMIRQEAIRLAILKRPWLLDQVPVVAAIVAITYEQFIDTVCRTVEEYDILRQEALRLVLSGEIPGTAANFIRAATARLQSGDVTFSQGCLELLSNEKRQLVDAIAAHLAPIAARKTRKTPCLHILTTESAGMTEGYVQTWIEEEMALYNIVRAGGMEDDVNALVGTYRQRLGAVARKVIAEFGMDVVVQEAMAEQKLNEDQAIGFVITSFKPVADEIGRLAVLVEADELLNGRPTQADNVSDPSAVEDVLLAQREDLEALARPQVAANNGRAFRAQLEALQANQPALSENDAIAAVISGETDYQYEVESIVRSNARQQVLDAWHRAHPELDLPARAVNYIRDRTGLALSTARKQVVAEEGLQDLSVDPRFYYQATGGNKRYNLLYTPSRVNLGEKERASVAVWRQWVGGSDRHAAKAGFDFYSLVNEGGVEERPALAYAEIQKTSENGLCVTHFAGSNALGLLVNAVSEGDVEDMADQMNLRNDRLVLPAGEGYGGYCVPKDGLFLAFVLSMGNDVKLRQMGIPEHLHAGVMQIARVAIERRGDFKTDSEWQNWAAQHLLQENVLKEYFVQQDDIPVFQVTKVARAILRLGAPWPVVADGDALLSNLAARWGVERMIVFAEQVNRFMVFYKAWMIYQCISEARSHFQFCPEEHEARIALTAEYKPVQDVRYSTGLRLYELFSGTGDHLYHSLDEHGQNIAYTLLDGFDPDTEHPVGRRAAREVMVTYGVDSDDAAMVKHLQKTFPRHAPPADLVLTSVTMCSTQDMLFYVSDTRMDQIADQVKVKLTDLGMTEKQMTADATVNGGDLRHWAGLQYLPPSELEPLIEEIGGSIHPLVLKLRGPGRDYSKDIQGIDVLNTGIPFPELLDLIDDMPRLVSLMMLGRPNSSLAIADGAAGKHRRALVERDIMSFFATCEKVGRRGTYRSIGLGNDNVERLRTQLHRKQEQAATVAAAYQAVADASEGAELLKAAQYAIARFNEVADDIVSDDEPGQALRTEEKLKRYNKWRTGDAFISQALAKIRSGLSASELDAGTWLAGLGGMFAVVGDGSAKIETQLSGIREGARRIADLANEGRVTCRKAGAGAQAFSGPEELDLIDALVRPAYVPEVQRFQQEMLVETSSKAVEVAAVEALERRKALKQRAARARAISERATAFDAYLATDQERSFDTCYADASQTLKSLDSAVARLEDIQDEDERDAVISEINEAFGHSLGATRVGLVALANEIWSGDSRETRRLRQAFADDAAIAITGREVILEDWKPLAGGYEDVGAIARLAEEARHDSAALHKVALGIELFYSAFALGQTLEFAVQERQDVDERLFWKRITDFFAETINDHWYDYLPWAYSRGIGFSDLSTDDLYELAVARHGWLYRFIRRLVIRITELADLPASDADSLLGNYLDGTQIPPIGGDGASEGERAWRCYNQLREIAFLKSDGFGIPPVFESFDPKLIDAENRINLLFLFPIGRTHISRAFREGPTLNLELAAAGLSGANLLVSRYESIEQIDGAIKPVVSIKSAHLYVGEEIYRAALLSEKGLSEAQADAILEAKRADGHLTPKGIRIAARFKKNGETAPIVAGSVVPFHGVPPFVSGELEDIGLPATVQSRIYSDITYDKSLYPTIFDESGVTLPAEHDWLEEYGKGLGEAAMLDAIEHGTRDGRFRGLRTFAEDYPLILIKGAAESGARNLKVFELRDGEIGWNEAEVKAAVQFVRDVGKKQSVVIQEALLTSPEFWASESLMQSFVERQILEWNRPVRRDRYPRSQIYSSLRVVASSANPDKPYDSSFLIALNSLQVATNVGRGGTLEMLTGEAVQDAFQDQIIAGLEAEAPKVMAAMERYAATYAQQYEAEHGTPVGEDIRGISYAWPPYLMSDYLITPVFERHGSLVDFEPVYDEAGKRTGSRVILEDSTGRFEGRITGWRYVHLEPNVGIGLWDRYNLREEERERRLSEAEDRAYNWDAVGQSDRIVLKNFVLAGAEYLEKVFGG